MFKINIIYWSGIDPCQNTDNVTKLLCFGASGSKQQQDSFSLQNGVTA